MYPHLGIDTTISYHDNSGRPHPILLVAYRGFHT
jgi:hypothetical protein